MVGPAVHSGLEEGAVDDQLTTAAEQIEQAHLTLRPIELVRLLHGLPRHPPTLGGHRVAGTGQSLLLHEELLARSLPLLRRHDRGRLHWKTPFPRLPVFLIVLLHTLSLVFLLLPLSFVAAELVFLSPRQMSLSFRVVSLRLDATCVLLVVRSNYRRKSKPWE